MQLACIASVSVAQKSEERGFWRFVRAKNKSRAKQEGGGWGTGRKETLADKPLDFENLRSTANDCLEWAIIIDMCRS